MKQFYETIPEELSEAARIDGLSEYGIYRRIMLPLSMPALASLALLTFVDHLERLPRPADLPARARSCAPSSSACARSSRQYNAEYALIMTGSVLSVLPIAVIFLLGQRYFVEGIATTGLKG